MIEAMIGLVAVLVFVLVMLYFDRRRDAKAKHAH